MADKNGTDGSDVIDGTVLGDTLRGLGGNDILDGKGGVDTLVGGTGADFVFGGAGRDFLVVGDGDTADGEIYDGGTFDNTDTLVISQTSSTIVGAFLVDFRASTLLSLEIVDMNTTVAVTARFAAASFGEDGLSGTLGFVGGTGKQVVEIEMRNDTLLDLSGLTFTNWSTSDEIRITGDAAGETILGSAQRDVVDAGGGIDSLSLGGGNDIVIVDETEIGDSYAGGDGIDQLLSTAGTVNLNVATLSGFEVLKMVGPGSHQVVLDSRQFGSGLELDATLNFTGDAAADTVIVNVSEASFNASNLFFFDFTGDDEFRLVGNAQANTITGSRVDDTISGGGGADLLIGGRGDDRLDGGSGADTMFGGLGNDVYIVNDAGDVAAEVLLGSDPGGVDRVQSSVSHTLTGFIENLTLVGAGTIDGTGNSLANTLLGNAAGNILSGLAGNDRLTGGLGADRLIGGTGSDRFIFRSTDESGAGGGNRDIVTDFERGIDKIDLRLIDANTDLAGVQSFTDSAGAAPGAGQFRIREVANGDTIIDINTDGDATIEMQIALAKVVGVKASDFLL